VKTLVILNDPPYGSERSYNGLRLAGALAKREGQEVRVFLMGDATACAKAGQTLPQGYYNLERMLRVVAQAKGEVGVCASCMDARGIGGARAGRPAQLARGAGRLEPLGGARACVLRDCRLPCLPAACNVRGSRPSGVPYCTSWYDLQR
jgi:uncharacterized protein involved in oxidation of intracellular sulfur